MVVAFIDTHKDRFGVQPICRVLSAHGVRIAPATYYAHKNRPPSPRAVRDANSQDPLFPVWRHHPFFTNSDEGTVTAD